MAYPDGYWIEFVRSVLNSRIFEFATGSRIWVRTSDGEPLEQEYFVNGNWISADSQQVRDFTARGDSNEPDFIGNANSAIPWRGRKTGEAWIPSDDGIALNAIAWAGATTFRVMPPEDASIPTAIGAVIVVGRSIGSALVTGVAIGSTIIWQA